MGTRNDPSEFDCRDKMAPDEPYFVLLARDPMAATLVKAWADELLRDFPYDDDELDEDGAWGRTDENDALHEKAVEAYACAKAMLAWKSKRDTRAAAMSKEAALRSALTECPEALTAQDCLEIAGRWAALDAAAHYWEQRCADLAEHVPTGGRCAECRRPKHPGRLCELSADAAAALAVELDSRKPR